MLHWMNLLCLTAIYKLLLIVNILDGEVKLVKISLRLVVDTFYALSLWCHNTWSELQKTRISIRPAQKRPLNAVTFNWCLAFCSSHCMMGILDIWCQKVRHELISSWEGQVVDSCEHGNEPLGSTKCTKFLDQLRSSSTALARTCTLRRSSV